MRRRPSVASLSAGIAASAAALAVASAAVPVVLLAQGTPAGADSSAAGSGVLVGFVKSPAGTPVPAARAEVDGDGRWITVTAAGEFRFHGLAAGPHVLRVRALGFKPIDGALTLAARDSMTVDVTLTPAVVALDTVRTVAPQSSSYGPAEFQERRRKGRGFFITRDEFERRAPSRMSDLLANVPGLMRRAVLDDMGASRYVLVMRGVSTARGEVCPIQIYLDGRNFDVGTEDLDRLIRPSDVEAIEIYVGSSQVPLRYAGPNARCGVLAFWTRSRGN